MPFYTVQQGEDLKKILYRDYGTCHVEAVKNHPENAEFFKERDEAVLYPGDRLFIPDNGLNATRAASGQTHTFQAKPGADGRKLMLFIKDYAGDPLANQPFCLTVEGEQGNGGQQGQIASSSTASSPEDRAGQTIYDFYRELIEGIGDFDADPNAVNIIGVRAWLNGQIVDNIADAYNDTIAVLWSDANGKYCFEFEGTVDPGAKYTKKALNKKGCAHLVDGQYRYKLGKHKSHEALVQAKAVKVWRDKDKDHTYDAGEAIESGWFGINVHAGGTGKKVGGYSAGCQVIKGGWTGAPWTQFLGIVKGHPKKTLIYTLIDSGLIDPSKYHPETAVCASDSQSDSAPMSSTGQNQQQEVIEGVTDANGYLEVMVLMLADKAELEIGGEKRVLRIAHLDPVDKLSGVQARLNNLGYNAGPVDGISGRRTKKAIKRFQKTRGISVDGVVGPQTRKHLKDAYGC